MNMMYDLLSCIQWRSAYCDLNKFWYQLGMASIVEAIAICIMQGPERVLGKGERHHPSDGGMMTPARSIPEC
jgi:hypothetical protein